MNDRWQKIEQLYHAARERDVTLQAAYLHEACAGDDALRQEVERLLAAREKPTGDLETPIQEAAAQMFDESFEEEPAESLIGRQLGSYHVLSKIGEGGIAQGLQRIRIGGRSYLRESLGLEGPEGIDERVRIAHI